MFVRSHRAAAFAASATALFLGGCSDDTTWFAKPVNMFGNRTGYSYAQLDQTRVDRAITANDLIDPNGGCPRYAPPAVPAQPPAPGGNPGDSAALPADANSLLSGGVALGMSECEVVSHLGQPTNFNISGNPNVQRSVVLTYNAGARPGIYHFESGRLAEMDRVAAPPPPEPDKKAAKTKKKPAKPADPSAAGAKS